MARMPAGRTIYILLVLLFLMWRRKTVFR